MKDLDKLLIDQKKYFRNTVIHASVNDRIVKIKSIRDWIKKNEWIIS